MYIFPSLGPYQKRLYILKVLTSDYSYSEMQIILYSDLVSFNLAIFTYSSSSFLVNFVEIS